MKYFLFSWKH